VIVCSCNNISEADIRHCASHAECRPTVAEVYATLGHRPNCGVCARTIKTIVADVVATAEHGENCSSCPIKAQVEASRQRVGRPAPVYDFLIGLGDCGPACGCKEQAA
jgi:bacterioferritin-associated ferredoxin